VIQFYWKTEQLNYILANVTLSIKFVYAWAKYVSRAVQRFYLNLKFFRTPRIFRPTLGEQLAFGKQLLYSSVSSTFYGWGIKQAIMSIQIIATSFDVVCRTKKKQTQTPQPCPVIRHNLTCSTSQCALIVQKYVQAVGFRISEVMVRILYGWHLLKFVNITDMTHWWLKVRCHDHLCYYHLHHSKKYSKRDQDIRG